MSCTPNQVIKLKSVTNTMAESLQRYPAYSGSYYFCHPDMRSKNPFCTVKAMYVSTWADVIDEIGQDPPGHVWSL